jgi:hypothetical protein
MECVTLDRYDEAGNPIYKPKVKYDTLDAAIAVAKIENAKNEHTEKVVAYKCKVCFKYHTGRNGKLLTDKERDKRRKELNKPVRFKVIGRIEL